ncbi:uncharacterized protein LOC141893220 isoform X2 [Acropora palmata]|uniref:uncharacterized protein LOC141893220 isoform X2 n=1 Tax=Acropora palmata TaxID=6131 RepID=UPI003D9FC02E
MFAASSFVPLVLTILFSSLESETATTAFSTTPSVPSYAVEGMNFTLEWTYTLDGSVSFTQFFNGSELIGKRSGPDQPSIAFISPNQTVNVSTLVWLDCEADSVPKATITWTRLSTNKTVGRPFNITGKQDQGIYRCTANNGIGNAATANVIVIVQYPVEARDSGENFTVAGGEAKIFTCPVDGNPEPNIEWYSEKTGRKISSAKELEARETGCYTCVASNSLGTPVNITQCLIVDRNLPPTTIPSQRSTRALSITKSTSSEREGKGTSATSTAKSTSAEQEVSAGPPWVIIVAVTGGVVVLLIAVGVLTWRLHKRRKCIKDTRIHNSDLERDEGGYSHVQGAYAQSGPPAASGADSAAEQHTEAEATMPTYASVDKSKKSKRQADERPPEYAVVDKSQKKEKQEAAAIPTYAAVDKSKKKKKSREEVPAVYAEVDKSKKKKKKKIDDKNLYDNLDEPKKEKKPGELLYADLGDFQNPSMPAVSISPQSLPAIKKADPYERTDYADITQFLKGNTTLPPNDGNGDTEMKPKRPSKNKIQGNDKETPI